jgi:hypothetical protein
MTTSPDRARIASQFDDLGQRIQAARGALQNKALASPEAEKEWRAMVDQHERIRSRLADAHNAGDDIFESARMDVETLSNTFGRWIEQIDTHASGSIGASPGSNG